MTGTKEEASYEARLGTIYEALLIIIFIGVPIAMILLRCFTLKNIRKLDLFFLFFAITFWFWIIWWSFLLYHGLNQWATFRGKNIFTCSVGKKMCMTYSYIELFIKSSLSLESDLRLFN